jgi:hypothetical protein
MTRFNLDDVIDAHERRDGCGARHDATASRSATRAASQSATSDSIHATDRSDIRIGLGKRPAAIAA